MKKQKEMKETISFSIVTKSIKYLGINLAKAKTICTQKTIKH